MDRRKEQILQAIIEDYIATAEPVGSRTLARKMRIGISPATIRNEMADLCEEGYLEQPHTSAGRIPSDKGYRYYVDSLLSLDQPGAEELERLAEELRRRHEARRLVQLAIQWLAQLSSYVTLAVLPGVSQVTVRRIDLLPLGDVRLLLIVVTDPGFVDSVVLDLKIPVDRREIMRLREILNRQLQGAGLSDLGRTIRQAIRDEMNQYLYDQMVEAVRQALLESDEDRVFVEGWPNLLRQPEFRQPERAARLLEVLNRPGEWLAQETSPGEQQVTVTIGRENREVVIQDCTVVAATYCVGGRPVGTITLIGPTRMKYGRVLPLMQQAASELSQALEDLSRPLRML
ncbi:MAG: heat-inducible transcription repressor HrcA [Limnochordaceae bacterium]|nr:heat-inducible transcription repressor HrcA [Limnochordaceae bacterium]